MIELDNQNKLEKTQNDHNELNSIDGTKIVPSDTDSMDATINVLKNYADRNILTSSHALLEIIKNSFDADATNVKIEFLKNSQIKIIDDGVGFTKIGYDAFKIVGKSNKKQNQKTKSGRTMTGMNGSGAYSTIKLGKHLKINSYNSDENFSLNKEVSWEEVFQNPDETLKKLLFIDIPNDCQKTVGTTFHLEKTIPSLDLIKIENDLKYPTINKNFKITISTPEKQLKNFNLLDQIDKMEKEEFINRSINFQYANGEIIIELKINKKIYKSNKKSKISDFTGSIQGRYLSINKNSWKKSGKILFPEEIIFDTKNDIAWNLFYNNQMLILTSKNLGIDFSKLAFKEKSAYGFRNSFGYTSISETNLIFDDSRTNIADDENGEHKKYQSILDEIYNETSKLLQKHLPENPLDKKTKKLVVPSPNSTFQPLSTLKMLPKAKVKSVEDQIFNNFVLFAKKLNSVNPFYNQISYCIRELQRVIKIPNYTTDWNISYHCLVRVYCEILFIYKIYEFFKNKNELNNAESVYKKNNGGFHSIGTLLNFLSTNTTSESKKLREDFQTKTNLNKLDKIQDLVKDLNKHIHNPQDGINLSITQDLIKIFSSWI